MALTAPNEAMILKVLQKHWEAELDAEVQGYIDDCKERLDNAKPELLARMVLKMMSHYDVFRSGPDLMIRVMDESRLSPPQGND